MDKKFFGLYIGLAVYIFLSLIAQIGQMYSDPGILGYFEKATMLFNFTTFLIPAIISNMFFPYGGIPDVIIVNIFALIEFILFGYIIVYFVIKLNKLKR
jgi:hypothetical protein